MSCYTREQQWTTNISNLRTQHHIQVTLIQDCCVRPRYEVRVDGQPLMNQQLIHNGCSPLCGPFGNCQWQQDGHNFLLVENSTLRCTGERRIRLFVDGIDADSGLEYSAYFRKRGWWWFWVGVVLTVVAGVGVGLMLIFKYYQDAAIRPTITFFVVGLLLLIFGLIAIRKFAKPLVLPCPVFPDQYNSAFATTTTNQTISSYPPPPYPGPDTDQRW